MKNAREEQEYNKTESLNLRMVSFKNIKYEEDES